MTTVLDILEDFLRIPFGHRKFGNPYQVSVSSTEELIELIKINFGEEPCMISVGTEKEDIAYLLDLFFDFDSGENNGLALIDAINVFSFFGLLNYKTLLVFSGLKGFHVHVLTEPFPYSQSYLRGFQEHIVRMFDCRTHDSKVFGQPMRLSRIPETVHEKSGYLSKILAYVDGRYLKLEDVFSHAEPFSLDELEISDTEFAETLPYHDYPCLEHKIRSPNPPHVVRFAWVVYRKLLGFSFNETLAELLKIGKKHWIDINEYKTEYQVRNIWGKCYMMPSCKLLQSYNVCEYCEYAAGL